MTVQNVSNISEGMTARSEFWHYERVSNIVIEHVGCLITWLRDCHQDSFFQFTGSVVPVTRVRFPVTSVRFSSTQDSFHSHQDLFFPATRVRLSSPQDSFFQSPGFVFPVTRIRFSSSQDSLHQ